MPLLSWILLAAAVGLGLTVELAFYRARVRDRGGAGRGGPEAGDAP